MTFYYREENHLSSNALAKGEGSLKIFRNKDAFTLVYSLNELTPGFCIYSVFIGLSPCA